MIYRNWAVVLLMSLTLATASGCVYRATVAQGNLIEEKNLEQLETGMTMNQVRFLLGTPMVDDPFHANRWDYVYYLKIGRNDAIAKRWVSVFFDNGLVSEIRRDQELDPGL